MSFVKISHFED